MSVKASNERGLGHLIKFMSRKKLICDVRQFRGDDRVQATYDYFCSATQDILKSRRSNQVVVCRMVETKKWVKTKVERAEQKDSALDLSDDVGGIDPFDGGGTDDEGSDEDGDVWLTFEPEANDAEVKEEAPEIEYRVEL